jgi:hypothetical protein
MKRILTVFAMSILAVSCAGKSSEEIAGSEAASNKLGISIGAVFVITTAALQEAVKASLVQPPAGKFRTVDRRDQLKYFGPVGGGLHQFKLVGSHWMVREVSITPYVVNLKAAVVEQLRNFPVSQKEICKLGAEPCWSTETKREIFVPVNKNVVAQSCFNGRPPD